MPEVKWIKMSTGLPDSRKLKQIRKLPDGDTIALLWVFLMCLAGKVNENGLIYFTPEIPYTDEMLADEFNMDVKTVRLGLTTFEKFGMLEIVNNIICLATWEKWQSVDRLAEIREYNRLAKQKSRQKQKLLQGVNDMSMTSQRCQDTEEDKEGDLEGEYKNNSIVHDSDESAPTKTRTRKVFKPPTLEEVQAYCQQRQNGVNAERFIDYYTSNGWMVGRNKMKDWKAAIRTWEKGQKESNTQKGAKNEEFNGVNVGTWF